MILFQNPINFSDWLQRIVLNRDPSIRTLGFQMMATLSSNRIGASQLIKEDPNVIWHQLMNVVQDCSECSQARDMAMTSLINFLKLSSEKNSIWIGPIITFSGIKLVGEGSLAPFFASIQFEESVGRMFKAFAKKHRPNLQVPNEESIRQTSLTATSLHDESEILDDPSSPSLMASILNFLTQVTKLDTVSHENDF